MYTVNFLIITACALSLFAVFYIDRKNLERKNRKEEHT
ncbi:hypothetical protein BH11BAC1_BH11BAC1_02070 [soil metagenome]